jgi:hypothetical protein
MKLKTIQSYKIIKAIKNFSGIDIENNRSRKRNVVEAKLLFCKLMRDEGYTYQYIGDCIGIDHATVLYHCKNYIYVKKASKELNELEINVMYNVGNESQQEIKEKILYHEKQIEYLKRYLLQSKKKIKKQSKILLTQNDDGNLELDKTFEEIYGKELEPKYKLVRERDGMLKTSAGVKWLEFNKDGTYKADFEDIAVGRSLLMSPFNPSFTWQTTPVTEIVDKTENYIKFATKNSVYELFKL